MSGRKRPTKPLDYSIATLMLIVWVANAGLIASAVFVYLNWRSVDWMVGSKAWSIVLMVVVSIALFMVLFAGCCILGFRQHIERTYLVLRRASTLRVFMLWILPAMVLALLLSLGFLSLVDTDVATQYIHEHSDRVFEAARQGDATISYARFLEYMTSLPAFKGYDEAELARIVQRDFDRISVKNTDGDKVITRPSMFHGFLASLDPLRIGFGASLLTCAGLLVFFVILYHVWYAKLTKSKFEEKVRELMASANLVRSAPRRDEVEFGDLGEDDAFALDEPDSEDPAPVLTLDDDRGAV